MKKTEEIKVPKIIKIHIHKVANNVDKAEICILVDNSLHTITTDIKRALRMVHHLATLGYKLEEENDI